MNEPKYFKYCLTEEQVSQFKSIFEKWILRGSRRLGERYTIDFHELDGFFKHLGFSLSKTEISETLLALGISSGTLGCQEVVRILGRRLIDEEIQSEIRGIFNFFDKNRDGKINAPDLKKGLKRLHEKVSNEDIDRLILMNDLDGDGEINYEEFLVLMLCR